jgi:hypothetical protein
MGKIREADFQRGKSQSAVNRLTRAGRDLGKGEVVSSILPGSTSKRALRIEAFSAFFGSGMMFTWHATQCEQMRVRAQLVARE